MKEEEKKVSKKRIYCPCDEVSCEEGEEEREK